MTTIKKYYQKFINGQTVIVIRNEYISAIGIFRRKHKRNNAKVYITEDEIQKNIGKEIIINQKYLEKYEKHLFHTKNLQKRMKDSESEPEQQVFFESYLQWKKVHESSIADIQNKIHSTLFSKQKFCRTQ